MENPANLVSLPTRVSDFSGKDYIELYFQEMIAAIPHPFSKPKSRDLELGWRAAILGACPVTGHLMYLPPGRSMCWVVIEDPQAQEAWFRFCLEKEMLNG